MVRRLRGKADKADRAGKIDGLVGLFIVTEEVVLEDYFNPFITINNRSI